MAKRGAPAALQQLVPHPMLQALVAQFLESNGFNSSHRIYNTERKKRPRKEGWQDTFAKSYTADFPPLESIFEEWKDKQWKNNETSSSDESDDTSSEEEVEKHETIASTSASSSASEPSDDDSDVDSDEDDSSSDSGDEEQASGTTSKVDPTAITPQRNSLKRKAPDSLSESSDESDSSNSSSESESDSEDDNPPMKKQRVESPVLRPDGDSDSESEASSDASSDSESLKNAIHTKLPSSDESSSSDDSSESDESSGSSSDEEEEARVVASTTSALEPAESDSSATITGDSIRKPVFPDSSSSESARGTTQVSGAEKKHMGAHPTRLAQISANADVNDYVSNTYVSYDYADKAFRDLSVTRGKGFTKEKNKKKRGSYRGGTIDIGGGKGFKFDE